MSMKETLSDVREFLEQVRIPIRLASITTSGWPVLISLWYLYQDGLLYCATQKSAKLVGYLQQDDRCAFEIAEDRPPYCGVRGQARAKIDDSLGDEILKKLLVRYFRSLDSDLAKKLLAKSQTEVAIVLEPTQVFSWDFSDRMRGIHAEYPLQKICL
jgi:nitroimidazol reductase NimA-like FMN-containing flavoprotein (pyridoxamine 5'-phosphate oxidase superfamily)